MKKLALTFLCLSLWCFTAAAIAQRAAAPARQPDAPRGAWTPPQEDISDYRDIVDYNIFRSDRTAIARKIDQQRNPPKPTEPRPIVTTPVTPSNPDASWLLVGLSHDSDGEIAYIENAESGEMLRLMGPAAFSQGEVTEIGFDAVVYKIDEQQRIIRIGQNFLGAKAEPRPDAGGTASSTKQSTSKPGDLQDRLRELRERRARELGGEAPSEPPTRPSEGDPIAESNAEADTEEAGAPAYDESDEDQSDEDELSPLTDPPTREQ